jgi:hypothetical protein
MVLLREMEKILFISNNNMQMKDNNLNDQLLKLGYSHKWLEFGLLTMELLHTQIITYEQDADENTEHYRYATFRNFLATKETLTVPEFDNYITLALSDEATTMAGAAMIDLFTKVNLTEVQFEKLVAQMIKLGDWTKDAIARQALLRKLKYQKLTNELFDECFEKGDNAIQEYLLGIANTEQLTRLSIQGRTKRIRNTAIQRLRTK